jgi:tRNA1(Val) A37 N6-methylase TrmN6
LARRVEGLAVTLVEIDPVLTELGRSNAERNGLASLVRAVCIDVGAPSAAFTAAGLAKETADRVLMNPPFNTLQYSSPEPGRRTAHSAPRGTLRQWMRTASRLLHDGGVLTLIWRADGLDEVLAELAFAFGAVSLLPVHGKPGAPAIRMLARATKGSRAPLALLPGLVLADATGKPSEAAEKVLRHGGILSLAEI